MAILFDGDCKGKAVDVELGVDTNGKPRVRWSMEVTEGPHAGKKASYSGKLDPENIKFTKRDMMAIGWKGTDAAGTFVSDVAAAAKVIPFTAETVSFTRDNGKTSQWTAAKNIGFQAQPLNAMDRETAKKVNGWFDEVGGDASPF